MSANVSVFSAFVSCLNVLSPTGRAGSPIFLLMFGALHTSSLQKINNLPVQDQKCPLMVFHGLSSGFVTEWADDTVLLSLTNTYTCTASLRSVTSSFLYFNFSFLASQTETFTLISFSQPHQILSKRKTPTNTPDRG